VVIAIPGNMPSTDALARNRLLVVLIDAT